MTNPSSPHNSQYFDNTRLTSFMACPRSYFFRHVKHWDRVSKPIFFTFGSAWHSGMDVIWLAAKTHSQADLLEMACIAFKQIWSSEVEEDYIPDIKEIRTPGLAREMFLNYLNMRYEQLKTYTVTKEGVEVPFMVPIIESSDIFYIGRIDKVFSERNDIVFAEHKTTTSYKKDGGFQASFVESFSPNNQVDGYIYHGKVAYGDKFKGVNIDAALVHKSARWFKTIPISRLEQISEGWVWETQYWISEIIDNLQFYNDLVASGDEPLYMPAFPKKTASCMSYQGYTKCTYHAICRFQSENPTFMECPDNFQVLPWEPFKIIMKEEEDENVESNND